MDEPTRYSVSGSGDGSAPKHRPVSLARPYARTGGRTRPDHDLSLDAVVTTAERGRRPDGTRTEEQRRICDFCCSANTVADIAAELRLPTGVVKVIVSDMSNAGLVLVHQPGLGLGDTPSREFMARMLDQLRTL